MESFVYETGIPATSMFFSRDVSFLRSIHAEERSSPAFTLNWTGQECSEIRLRAVDDAVVVGVALLW